MKICVFGAGALGGVFGGHLALGGEDVTMIARGANLATLKTGGIKLVAGDTERVAKPRVTDSPREAGVQDIVILATKAYSLPEAAEAIGPMLGPDTGVVLIQNGLQWWYFHGLGGALQGKRLRSIDAEGKCETVIGVERTIGAEVYCPAETIAPGTVRHGPGPKIVMAEATGVKTPRIAALASALEKSGVTAEIAADMRLELWKKLMALIAGAPVAVLTGANNRAMSRDDGIRAVQARLTREAMDVAAKVGVKLPGSMLDRFKAPGDAPPNKVSTLQDLERNRPLEIDAIVGVVAEIGRMTDVPTPTVDAVYALCRLKAVGLGLYPANPGFALDYEIG
jgi:2-dehydropantoate 2-reductase